MTLVDDGVVTHHPTLESLQRIIKNKNEKKNGVFVAHPVTTKIQTSFVGRWKKFNEVSKHTQHLFKFVHLFVLLLVILVAFDICKQRHQ